MELIKNITDTYCNKAGEINLWLIHFMNDIVMKQLGLNPDNIVNPIYFIPVAFVFSVIGLFYFNKISDIIKCFLVCFILSVPITAIVGVVGFIALMVIVLIALILYWISYIMIFAIPLIAILLLLWVGRKIINYRQVTTQKN